MKILDREFLSIFRQPTSDEVMPKCELSLHGCPTGIVLEGAVYQAALEWNGHFLLLLTDDILHEDSLHAYFLNAQPKLLDSGTLGAMYSTGAFSDLRIVGPDKVEFEFFGGVTWTIEMLRQPHCGLFHFPRRGVSRPLQKRRHFMLYSNGKVLPQT